MPRFQHPAGEFSAGLVVDPELIRKYGGNGPRYTSYPTADRFVEAFDAAAYQYWLQNRNIRKTGKALSLYVHLPFCNTICYYCACNKIITRDHGRSARYIRYLEREIGLVAESLGGDRAVSKMHWGGGTPTFLSEREMEELMRAIRARFDLDPAGEYAIEVDPRKVEAERIAHLASLGFNRISLGVQDFNPQVQRAVNRVQSVGETERVIKAARANRFKSVNIDLIYGLPKQDVAGFTETLELVVGCDPDRIALYSYAHLPSVFKPQRRIAGADLPGAENKLGLLVTAIGRLQAAGYVYIGMDHFAKPGDELAVAQRQGRLRRDFQGYSAGGDFDTVGLGVSAISRIGPVYAQNAKILDDYHDLIEHNSLPVTRGIELSADDMVRRAVINALACDFMVSKESISIAYLIEFDRYFSAELEDLGQLAADGLVEIDRDWINVTPRGRLLVRAVCMVFDRYFRIAGRRAHYSRVM